MENVVPKKNGRETRCALKERPAVWLDILLRAQVVRYRIRKFFKSVCLKPLPLKKLFRLLRLKRTTWWPVQALSPIKGEVNEEKGDQIICRLLPKSPEANNNNNKTLVETTVTTNSRMPTKALNLTSDDHLVQENLRLNCTKLVVLSLMYSPYSNGKTRKSERHRLRTSHKNIA